MTEPLVQVNNLTVLFGQATNRSRVVDNVSFSIQPGQCLGLVGESGSGKTLTALAMMQLLPHTACIGQSSMVMMHGKDILSLSRQQLQSVRGGSIAMVFQDASTALNPVTTIGQQIIESLRLHLKVAKKSCKNHVLTLLDEVGMRDCERCFHSYPHELSGGMRQRAMIAMALSGEPELLIADEPTTALDVTVQAQVIALLQSLQQKRQMTMLFIGHDLAVIAKLADNIVVLRQGKVVEQAQATQFFKQPQHSYSQQLLASIPGESLVQPALDPAALLRVNDLKVHFPIKKGVLKRTVDHVKAVDGIDLTVLKGQTLAIVGESGSGKTTTAKAIVQLIKPTAGTMSFLDQDASRLTARTRRQWHANVQMIFQDPHAALNPRMRIFDCIVEGVLAQKKRFSQTALLAKVDALLTQVLLPVDAKWHYPHEFSGGERQRICIARALALQPQCLILDEPTSALDVSIQMQVLNLLVDLQQQYQLSYVLITHNISLVAALAHSVLVMHQGQVVEQGLVSEVLENPRHPYTQQLLQAVPILQTPGCESGFTDKDSYE